MKRVVTMAILLVALGGIAYVFVGDALRPGSEHVDPPMSEDHTQGPTGLTVYYFDMGKDCTTCLNLEAYTYETLARYFGEKLASGAIAWQVVDVDLKENGHFVEEFGLYTKSVVLARHEGEAIVWHDNLSRIWELVYDKEAYTDYIRAQVEQALGAVS